MSASVTAPVTAAARDAPPRSLFFALALACGTFAVLQSELGPALPTIQRDLSASSVQASWVVTAYLLTACIATPLAGRLGDIFGKGRVLRLTMFVLIGSCLLAAVSPTVQVLLAARAAQGIAGGIVPLSFGLVRDLHPDRLLARSIGALSATVGIGGGVGTIGAGPVIATFGWRWLFWLPLVAAVLATAFVVRLLPLGRPGSPTSVNWLAALLLSGWLTAALLAISQGSTWGWSSGRIVGLSVAAVALAGWWAAVELRARVPLIDIRMLAARAVWTTNAAGLAIGFTVFAIVAYLPQFVQVPSGSGWGLGLTPSQAGLVRMPMLFTVSVAGMMAGRMNRISPRVQLTGAACCATAGCLWFALWHSNAWQVAAACGVYGVGIGVSFAAMPYVLVQHVPADQTGTATAMNANVRNIGGAAGTALFGALVAVHAGALAPAESRYVEAFGVLAVAGALGIVAGLLVPTRARGTAAERDTQPEIVSVSETAPQS
jgi:MFS family permease